MSAPLTLEDRKAQLEEAIEADNELGVYHMIPAYRVQLLLINELLSLKERVSAVENRG